MIDLSMTIKDHWRWSIEHSLKYDFEKGNDFRSSVVKLGVHAFTHVDSPLHCKQGGETIENLDVDAYSGTAAIVDLSFIQPNEAIAIDHVKKHGAHIQQNEIVLLKTCWDDQRDPYSKEYWTEAPYINEEATLWLKDRKPRAVGFDFPQDYPLREIDRGGDFNLNESTTHKHLLYNDILHIEYLCNMKSVTKERVELIALPLKFAGLEGVPARVVVLE